MFHSNIDDETLEKYIWNEEIQTPILNKIQFKHGVHKSGLITVIFYDKQFERKKSTKSKYATTLVTKLIF